MNEMEQEAPSSPLKKNIIKIVLAGINYIVYGYFLLLVFLLLSLLFINVAVMTRGDFSFMKQVPFLNWGGNAEFSLGNPSDVSNIVQSMGIVALVLGFFADLLKKFFHQGKNQPLGFYTLIFMVVLNLALSATVPMLTQRISDAGGYFVVQLLLSLVVGVPAIILYFFSWVISAINERIV